MEKEECPSTNPLIPISQQNFQLRRTAETHTKEEQSLEACPVPPYFAT